MYTHARDFDSMINDFKSTSDVDYLSMLSKNFTQMEDAVSDTGMDFALKSQIVDELSETTRGKGGFGSTGK